MFHLLIIAFRSFCRLAANHCIIPSLRLFLFRLSGIKIGRNAFINMDVRFIDDWKPHLIKLGDEVSVAPFVSFVATSNPNHSFIDRDYEISKQGAILINRGAWIGAGAVILPGVTIGEGAIIGANAVVSHPVAPFTIMTGIPARPIGDVRKHFPPRPCT